MNQILSFLSRLKSNNNRDWFNSHKEEYHSAKNEFEKLCSDLIFRMSEFDEEIGKVNLKECFFRIYRDIRFSPDKTPYKTHFGAYMAYPGGRKSPRAGYYLHLEPGGKSFFSAGVWSPQPLVLHALRRTIYEHYDEFNELRNEADFQKFFKNSFYEEDKLKKIPAGFPADFEDPEILKLKHYLVSRDFTEKELADKNFPDFTADLAKQAFPFVQFLNYAIDEIST